MDLDKRIIEGKKPLDCFDAKDARKQFIGKKGFFGAHESQFMDLDSCPKCVLDELKEVDNYAESPFMTSCNHCYRFFLPEEWVKEPEKKYRPFSIDSWLLNNNTGDVIHFRRKDNAIEHYMMFTGYSTEAGTDMTAYGIGAVILGGYQYAFQTLFESYEIMINGEWQPFGVIKDD